MNQTIIKDLSKQYKQKNIPLFKPGLTVRVHQKIKEGNKERVQIFEGLIISVSGGGKDINSTITVRKVIDGYGVEKIFPIHSKNITKFEITKAAKVRRAKLYFMRDRFGKSARLPEKHVNTKDYIVDESASAEAEEKKLEAPAEAEEKKLEAPVEAEEKKLEAPVEAEEKKLEAPAEAEEKKLEAPAEEKNDQVTDEPAKEEEKSESASAKASDSVKTSTDKPSDKE